MLEKDLWIDIPSGSLVQLTDDGREPICLAKRPGFSPVIVARGPLARDVFMVLSGKKEE